MEMNANQIDITEFLSLAGSSLDLPQTDAELVLLKPRRDILVRMGVDVRVDAQSDVSHFAFGHSELINHLHLGNAFHIKALNFSIEGKVNLPIGLAYASIDDFLGVKAMLERARTSFPLTQSTPRP